MEGRTTSSGRRIVIRADATPAMGGGHVMRCLTLAHALRAAGADILFVTNAQAPLVVSALAASGCDRVDAGEDTGTAVDAIAAHWPGGADAAIVDHYGLDARDEHRLRAVARTLLVIDDLADRPHDCDLLLDQSFGRDARDYEGLVPEHARLFAGAGFALLRPEFAMLRPASLARRKIRRPVSRLFVSFGLSDLGGATETALHGLSGLGFAIDVAVGGAALSLPRLRALARERADVTLHVDADDVAALMTEADIAVGASGSTSWERCCLGLPGVALVLAENQRMIARELEEAGALTLVQDIDGGAIREAVLALAENPERQFRMSDAAAAICDGTGADRIARAITDGARVAPSFTMRPAAETDAVGVWVRRDAPDARRFAHASAPISWDDHLTWYRRASADPERQVLVAVVDGRDAATLRFDRMDDADRSWLVGIAVGLGHRRRGLGTRVLSEGCTMLETRLAPSCIVAEIHGDNTASQRLFEACGFARSGGTNEAGFERYERRAPTLTEY